MITGFRFYIPAYKAWAVRNHPSSDSIIANFTIYPIDPFHYLFKNISFWKWFTEEQIVALTKFLEFAVRNEDALDAVEARNNLARIKEGQPIERPCENS